MGNKWKHPGWGAGGRAGAGLLFCKEHWDGGQVGDGAAELRGEAECTRMAAGGVQGAAGSRGGQDRAKDPRLKTAARNPEGAVEEPGCIPTGLLSPGIFYP